MLTVWSYTFLFDFYFGCAMAARLKDRRDCNRTLLIRNAIDCLRFWLEKGLFWGNKFLHILGYHYWIHFWNLADERQSLTEPFVKFFQFRVGFVFGTIFSTPLLDLNVNLV